MNGQVKIITGYPEGSPRDILSFDDKIFYKSSGSNSGMPNTFFPILGILENQLASKQPRGYFMKPPLPYFPKEIYKYFRQHSSVKEFNAFEKRFSNLEDIIISMKLGGGFWEGSNGQELKSFVETSFPQEVSKIDHKYNDIITKVQNHYNHENSDVQVIKLDGKDNNIEIINEQTNSLAYKNRLKDQCHSTPYQQASLTQNNKARKRLTKSNASSSSDQRKRNMRFACAALLSCSKNVLISSIVGCLVGGVIGGVIGFMAGGINVGAGAALGCATGTALGGTIGCFFSNKTKTKEKPIVKSTYQSNVNQFDNSRKLGY